MKKRKKTLIITLAAVSISVVSVMGSITFAWFQANATATVSTSSSSATITVSEPEQSLRITKIKVMGDTTTSITPSYTSTANGNYQMALTDTRKLTDVSGDASKDGSNVDMSPVQLFKPVFASNYDETEVNSGYATIFDVSDQTTSFSTLSTGDAYPYVRFGFKVTNITNSSKSVYPVYTLTESSGNMARVSVCRLDDLSEVSSSEASANDYSDVEHEDWTELAYLATEAEAVTPIASASSNPGYQFVVDSTTEPSIITISGDTFSTYLGQSKTSINASSGYAPNSSIATLAANGNSGDTAYFCVTIWVEGQDPDCWSTITTSNNISFRIDLI